MVTRDALVISPRAVGMKFTSGYEEAEMTTSPAGSPGAGALANGRGTLRLSRLLRRPVADRSGEALGKLADVIVRLRGA